MPSADHCVRVMQGLPEEATEDERHAALLHDVLEDLPVFAEDLRDMGYSERTIWLVEMLSRKPAQPYLEYVRDLKGTGDVGLIAIKLADNADNADPSRGASIPASLVKRYADARRILIGAH